MPKPAGGFSATRGAGEVGAARWPAGGRAGEGPPFYRYLLDLDADLADEFDVGMRLAVRAAATALTFEAEAGPAELAGWLARASGGPGLLVLGGVVAEHVRVGDRIVSELLGDGDVLTPREAAGHVEMLPCEVSWRALTPLRLAVLDAAFAERVAPWPALTRMLARRVGRRARNLNVQRAIAAQPRLEVRLALLLWHLAARWGKVERGGILLPLPLTHHLLGRLVGAERPSVSHALARLTHSGLVTGHGDEWHLHGSLGEELAMMFEPEGNRAEQLVAAVVALRPRPRMAPKARAARR